MAVMADEESTSGVYSDIVRTNILNEIKVQRRMNYFAWHLYYYPPPLLKLILSKLSEKRFKKKVRKVLKLEDAIKFAYSLKIYRSRRNYGNLLYSQFFPAKFQVKSMHY